MPLDDDKLDELRQEMLRMQQAQDQRLLNAFDKFFKAQNERDARQEQFLEQLTAILAQAQQDQGAGATPAPPAEAEQPQAIPHPHQPVIPPELPAVAPERPVEAPLPDPLSGAFRPPAAPQALDLEPEREIIAQPAPAAPQAPQVPAPPAPPPEAPDAPQAPQIDLGGADIPAPPQLGGQLPDTLPDLAFSVDVAPPEVPEFAVPSQDVPFQAPAAPTVHYTEELFQELPPESPAPVEPPAVANQDHAVPPQALPPLPELDRLRELPVEDIIREWRGEVRVPPVPEPAEPIVGAAVSADDPTGRQAEQLRLLKNENRSHFDAYMQVAENFRKYHDELLATLEYLASSLHSQTHDLYVVRLKVEHLEIDHARQEAPYHS